MILFSCTVRARPIPQGRARTTRFGTFYPKSSKEHRHLLVDSFQCANIGQWININEPVSVLIEVAGSRANGDLDNHCKAVLDALVDAGVLASDDVRVVQELIVRVVEGEPRTKVTIRTMDANKPDASRRPEKEKTK